MAAQHRMPVGLCDVCGAAAGGRLDVLRWAREHGCDWHASTCSIAAYRGHLAVLQRARAHGCPWDWTKRVHLLVRAGTWRC